MGPVAPGWFSEFRGRLGLCTTESLGLDIPVLIFGPCALQLHHASPIDRTPPSSWCSPQISGLNGPARNERSCNFARDLLSKIISLSKSNLRGKGGRTPREAPKSDHPCGKMMGLSVGMLRPVSNLCHWSRTKSVNCFWTRCHGQPFFL